MRTVISALLILTVTVLPALAGAYEIPKPRPATVVGEIVDTGCFLGHMGTGAGHVECATKCINLGMPMGVLTSKGTLYLITMNHDDPDPYRKLKGMAGKKVAVFGQIHSRAGMKAIEATSFKLARGA